LNIVHPSAGHRAKRETTTRELIVTALLGVGLALPDAGRFFDGDDGAAPPRTPYFFTSLAALSSSVHDEPSVKVCVDQKDDKKMYQMSEAYQICRDINTIFLPFHYLDLLYNNFDRTCAIHPTTYRQQIDTNK
jgi:hypothetical protein